MKLLSPVSSLASAKAQISAGANEIYVGLRTGVYNNYSFSGRGQGSDIYKSIVPDKKELREIVNLSHSRNVEVSLAANTPLFSDSFDKNDETTLNYINYVETGIDCGVDNIIVGDIGLIYQLHKMNLPVNIHASTFLDSMNIEQLYFLKDLGVTRAVLTYQISFEEIKKLCEAKVLEIEVFGYLSCSFFNGSCNLIHNMGEDNSVEGIHLGTPCKALYKVWAENIEERVIPFFDAELGCALCSIKKLQEAGVDVIKIAGRDRNYDLIALVTSTFSKAIALTSDKNNKEYEEELQNMTYAWWKKIWCSKNRCKYRDNEITRSFIGNL